LNILMFDAAAAAAAARRCMTLPPPAHDVNRTENQYLSCSFCSSPAPFAPLQLATTTFVWGCIQIQTRFSDDFRGNILAPVARDEAKAATNKKVGGGTAKRFLWLFYQTNLQ
jgi:hypothetical protein